MITKYTIETDDESADRISASQTVHGQSPECSDEQLPLSAMEQQTHTSWTSCRVVEGVGSKLQRLQKGQQKEPYKVRTKASQPHWGPLGFGSRFCNLRIHLYGSTFCDQRLDIEW